MLMTMVPNSFVQATVVPICCCRPLQCPFIYAGHNGANLSILPLCLLATAVTVCSCWPQWCRFVYASHTVLLSLCWPHWWQFVYADDSCASKSVLATALTMQTIMLGIAIGTLSMLAIADLSIPYRLQVAQVSHPATLVAVYLC